MWTVDETQDNSPASKGFRLTITDNFVCKSQELIAIIGKVGSGKSLFINSLLGETCCTGASMYVENGIKALVPQSAWILNCSVRDNIIFDNHFDLNIYTRVLEACQLTVDIKSFAELDQTMIGERGVTLSGGQKQRVSLARAAYACLVGKAKIIVMDDPLSALDAHTSKICI